MSGSRRLVVSIVIIVVVLFVTLVAILPGFTVGSP